METSIVRDARETLCRGFIASRLARAGIRTEGEDAKIGDEYMNWTCGDFVRELSTDPRPPRGSNDRLIGSAMTSRYGRERLRLMGPVETRALGTSDFPALLTNLANKALAIGYTEQRATYDAWVRKASVPDFKTRTVTQLSGIEDLEYIPEGAPVPNAALSDRAESYAIGTYSKIIPITRQALVNDDLGAFVRLNVSAGSAARRTVNKAVYAILNNGATSAWNMSDGNPLFDASNHKNYGTAGTALDATTLKAAINAMMIQTGLRGEIITTYPRWLIVPPALQFTAEELIYSNAKVEANFSAGVTNVFKSHGPRIDVLTDAQIAAVGGGSDTAWYLAAAPMELDTVEVGFLNGRDIATIEEQDDFDSFGMRWRVYIDFGVKPLDWRGLIKRSGEAGGG